MHKIKLYTLTYFLSCTIIMHTQQENSASIIESNSTQTQKKRKFDYQDQTHNNIKDIINAIRQEIINSHPELLKKQDFRELEILVISATKKLGIPFDQSNFITTEDGLYRDCGTSQTQDIDTYYKPHVSRQQMQSIQQHDKKARMRIMTKNNPRLINCHKASYNDILKELSLIQKNSTNQATKPRRIHHNHK